MPLIDLATLFSYFALTSDILLQIKNIYRTKSSNDLSLIGMSIRYIAILIIWFKFFTLSDMPLVIGQSLVAISFTTYLALATLYFYKNRESK